MKIIGNTIGTGLPKPNLMQTDPTKGDFVKGKEEFIQQFSGGSGESGADGFSPIATVTRTNDGADISITDKNGTTIATVYDGKDGKNAKIAILNVESLAAGATPSATVTDTAAGSIITLKIPKGDPGKDGVDGDDGSDGFSPTVGVSKSGKVTTVTVVDKNGAKSATINDGADGYSPVRGKDYWTPSDIAEIKSYVDEAILGGAW